jgi:threonylcarbamoyladenosine tRNA methylthiotransferase MtaB
MGCKVNQYDSQRIREGLLAAGHIEVDLSDPGVDLALVNTCTVTHRADADGRRAVRRALRSGAAVVVTGCGAVVYPEALRSEFAGVNVVRPERLPHLLGMELPRFVSGLCGRSRAFVVAQTGCDRFCSYCVVPLARGVPRSRPWQDVVTEAGNLAASGIEEVVLTGVNLGLYEGGLTRLVHRLLRHTGVGRVRISSLEPFTLEDGLVDLMASESRLCSHLHLSIQHGSDRILRAMNRPYASADIRSLVSRIALAVPGASIGADIIVGFPGEDEGDFLETCSLVSELPFTYLHVFPFSPRPYTPASRMEGRVPPPVVSRRASVLRALSIGKRQAFAETRIGSVEEVVVTREAKGCVFGMSSSYMGVVASIASRPGRMVPLRITGVHGHVLTGEPLA